MGLSFIDMPDGPEPRPLLGLPRGLGPTVPANCRGLNMGMAIAAVSLCRGHDAPRGGPVAFGHRIRRIPAHARKRSPAATHCERHATAATPISVMNLNKVRCGERQAF